MNTINVSYIILSSILIIMGLFMYFKPPKDANSFVGFRTRKSGKTQSNWDLAQKLCGKYLIIIGIVSSIAFAISLILLEKDTISYTSAGYAVFVPIVLLIVMAFFIQRKLPD